ncbi:hypothetical protein [Corynebacterium halotolerans]|uniref:hypothetical protein n=1 Tax=Corynebacterium halotolerans TaxID=225326 RepID=UPI003CE7D41A
MPKFRPAAVLAGGLALTLSACSDAEPMSNQDSGTNRPLVIIAVPDPEDSTEQLVLGELYEHTMLANDREAVTDIVPSTTTDEHGVSLLSSSRADMMIGCTGDLLGAFDPVRAEELKAEIAAAEDPAAARKDVRQQVYDELVSVLPSQYDAPDPSPAEACGGEATGLPQNIVPVFLKTSVGRTELQAMNKLGRALTTEDIEDVVADARETGSVQEAAGNYFEGAGSYPGGDVQVDSGAGPA